MWCINCWMQCYTFIQEMFATETWNRATVWLIASAGKSIWCKCRVWVNRYYGNNFYQRECMSSTSPESTWNAIRTEIVFCGDNGIHGCLSNFVIGCRETNFYEFLNCIFDESWQIILFVAFSDCLLKHSTHFHCFFELKFFNSIEKISQV